METFNKSEDFYGVLFHELVHSTGHGERLNRKELLESKGMRSEKYAIEELTAEMGASYLKSYAGIPIKQLENNASYIQSWLVHLKNDKKFIVHSSAQAQKATDFILNVSPEMEIDLIWNVESQKKRRNEELSSVREKNKKNNEISVEI